MDDRLVRTSVRVDPDVSYAYGIVLPNVVSEHRSVKSQQEEYDQWEIRDIDLTGLPSLANHKGERIPLGHVAGYEPRANEARVLLALDNDSFRGHFGEAAVTSGLYGSLSLTHKYDTDGIVKGSAVDGAVSASIVKRAIEVSLVDEPWRAGSHVLQVCPSKTALLRQPYEYLRRFAERYSYPNPPIVPPDPTAVGVTTAQIASNTPALRDYVCNRLAPMVRARLQTVVDNAQFVRRRAISPTRETHGVTVETGVVRMSATGGVQSSFPGATVGGSNTSNSSNNGAPPSDSMQLDAPSNPNVPATNASGNAASGGTPPQQAAKSADASAGAPKTAATTESRVSQSNMDADDDPRAVLLKVHSRAQALEKELEKYKAQEKAQKVAEEAERARQAKEKLTSFDVNLQTAVSTLAHNMKAQPAEEQKMLEGAKKFNEVADEFGIPADKRQQMLGHMFEGTVSASKRARLAQEDEKQRELSETARAITQQLRAANTAATIHGGYHDDAMAADAPPTQTVPASSSSSAAVPAPVFVVPSSNPFGLSASDYERKKLSAEQAARMVGMTTTSTQALGAVTGAQSGTVSAGRDAAATAGRGGRVEELDPNKPGVLRQVYESLITVNEDGTFELPSYDEVAQGGKVIERTIKRSLHGDEIAVETARARWAQPARVGMQHLFPDVFAQIVASMQPYEAPLKENELAKMAALGKMHAQQRFIPDVVSRRNKNNPSKNWRYLDPRRKGTEGLADLDIRGQPLIDMPYVLKPSNDRT